MITYNFRIEEHKTDQILSTKVPGPRRTELMRTVGEWTGGTQAISERMMTGSFARDLRRVVSMNSTRVPEHGTHMTVGEALRSSKHEVIKRLLPELGGALSRKMHIEALGDGCVGRRFSVGSDRDPQVVTTHSVEHILGRHDRLALSEAVSQVLAARPLDNGVMELFSLPRLSPGGTEVWFQERRCVRLHNRLGCRLSR